MISTIPAHLLGLYDQGKLKPWLCADIVVLEKASRHIATTISGGCFAIWLRYC
ncbi:MAG: hypothetical protein OXC62_14675 [Aestuariivita sp.]|nr:hypothetical protein [Aestuariivita sp.]